MSEVYDASGRDEFGLPEPEIVSLSDEAGEDVLFLQLDTIHTRGHDYLVLMEMPPEGEEPEDDDVLIFRVDVDEDGNETYAMEEDEDLNDWVYNVFCMDSEEYEVADAE